MFNGIDPRTKLFIVLCISSLGLVFANVFALIALLGIGLAVSIGFKSNPYVLLKRFGKLFYVFLGMILVQSLFVRGGYPLISIGKVALITNLGLERGLAYLLRVLLILICGSIVGTCDSRQLIQSLVQLKIPYDLAFMSSLGIRFLPLLIEDFRDTFQAIELRGIDIKKLALKKRIELLSYILTPVFAGTLQKAKALSHSVENRAFRAYSSRTSITVLTMSALDWILIIISLIIVIAFIFTV